MIGLWFAHNIVLTPLFFGDSYILHVIIGLIGLRYNEFNRGPLRVCNQSQCDFKTKECSLQYSSADAKPIN